MSETGVAAPETEPPPAAPPQVTSPQATPPLAALPKAAPPKAAPKSRAAGRSREFGLQLILPAIVAVLAVSLFPMAATLFLGLQQEPNGFQALQADTRLWDAARETLFLASVALPVELVLGLALACLFLGRMPGKGVFVFLLAVPAVAAPVIGGAAWQMLLDNDYGPFNQILGWIVGGAVVVLWTEKPDFAYLAVLIADIWQWTPFMFVLLLAALGNVDRALLEVAEVDDAGPWRILLRVVIPAIRPAIAIAVLIRALDLARLFDVVWALTRGGPQRSTETLSVLAYDRLAQTSQMSRTAAMCFVMLVAVTLVATALFSGMERSR